MSENTAIKDMVESQAVKLEQVQGVVEMFRDKILNEHDIEPGWDIIFNGMQAELENIQTGLGEIAGKLMPLNNE